MRLINPTHHAAHVLCSSYPVYVHVSLKFKRVMHRFVCAQIFSILMVFLTTVNTVIQFANVGTAGKHLEIKREIN